MVRNRRLWVPELAWPVVIITPGQDRFSVRYNPCYVDGIVLVENIGYWYPLVEVYPDTPPIEVSFYVPEDEREREIAMEIIMGIIDIAKRKR